MLHSSDPQPELSVWFGLDQCCDATSLARASAQLERVLEQGLLSSMEIAVRLLQLLGDPEYSVDEVARVIEGDPALTTRVLRVANGAMFTLRQPCREVSHAVTMLGARTVSEIAAAAAAADLYGHHGIEGQLRTHAVSTAAVARELAQRLERPVMDVFLVGLLHDVGKLVMFQGAGSERYGTEGLGYGDLLERRGGQAGGTHLLEQAALGFDHAAMGSAALQAWGIPDPLPAVVGGHHDVARVIQEGGRSAELVCLIRLADSLVHAFGGARLGDTASRIMLREPAATAWLELDPDRIGAMIPGLRHAHTTAADFLG